MSEKKETKFNLQQVRETLANKGGQEYWRSMDQVAQTPEFEAWVEDEFPNRSSIMQIDRRDFIKFMGASMMLAGMAGCRSMFLPTEKIVPYVMKPEDIIPGKALQFATVFPHNQSSLGVLVTSYEGRPVKIEGNPSHPNSLGATDHFAQATILDLYDPDRSREVFKKNLPSSWDVLLREARAAMDATDKGNGIVVLTESVVSPTLAAELGGLKKAFPLAKVVQYDAVSQDNALEGANLGRGARLHARYSLTGCDVIASFDGDFIQSMPENVRMSREFSDKRKTTEMNRLYVVESSPTLTGAMADHRRAVKPSQIEANLRALAQSLGVAGIELGAEKVDARFIAAMASDLGSATKKVVIVGASASAASHAIAHAINEALSGSVTYHAPVVPQATSQIDALSDLTKAINAGQIEVLVVLGGNPAFDAPADLEFGKALTKVKFSLHHTMHFNETSQGCLFQVPMSHFLEHWSDATTLDGTVAIQQPLIAPIHNTKSALELVSSLQNRPRSSYELVKAKHGIGKDTTQFEKWLNDGVITAANTLYSAPGLKAGSAAGLPVQKSSNGIEIAFRPDPTLWDGRWANNGWMQELPKPLTTLTWDNPVLISPKMADDMGVADGDHVTITLGKQSLRIPVCVTVGHSDDVVTLNFGNGRTEVGSVGHQAGQNVNVLRNATGFWDAAGVTVAKATGGLLESNHTDLALTQTHHSMEGRDIIRAFNRDEFAKEGMEKEEEGVSMFPPQEKEFPFEGPQWGMSIDLNVCTGCHACVTACQAENNIPVIGRIHVLKGREMHWMRIDRYYTVSAGGKQVDPRDEIDSPNHKQDVFNPDAVKTVMMPLACMHCEIAPCEPVCPVAATVHSHEGLNQMVYNRCVGTRYCSNNCPYKVRRFNFLNYTDNQPNFMDRTEVPYTWTITSSEKNNGRSLLKMIANPNVTVRGRGVMEKCTYCVQRINEVRIEAKKEQREIKDGEIVTACQQACPSGAIVFGNIADKNSAVSKLKANKRDYSLLAELNTRNRTTYLAKLRNPNPELENA